MRFDTKNAALLLVDLQRSFCCDDGSVAVQGRDISPCRVASDRCLELATAARAAGMRVIWTRLCYRADYADGGLMMSELRPGLSKVKALIDGDEDANLIPEANVAEEDIIIEKQRYSSFYATPLSAVLGTLKIDTLMVGGVTTSMCVETTVRDSAQRDYRTFVVENACGDFNPERHRASLAAMAFGFAPVLSMENAMTAIQTGLGEFYPT